MERKLASIREIKNIRPIEGADRIVCAEVDGWEVVTQKSNGFQPGDKVVYFEIDSLLPIDEKFSFLEAHRVKATNSVNGEGYRLRTIKLRGQISQGLILPLSELPELENVSVGDDVTELLGVKKYEKPIPAQLAGVVRGNFPSFLRKTDQERIQNCIDSFVDKWSQYTFEATIKLDGSSFTAYYHKETDRFGVCSRNLDLAPSEDNAFWRVCRDIDLEDKMRTLSRPLAIQGELMGPGVQGNRENLERLTLFVFDVFDIEQQKYLDATERYAVCQVLNLTHVPVVDVDVFSGFLTVKDFLRYAERPSLNHAQAEGVVFKCLQKPEISFKCISNAYLLNGGE